MRIISFDVGIKNMAYCIFDVERNPDTPRFSIVEWKTVNLMNDEDTVKPEVFICSCNNKSKKGVNPKCTRQACYMKSVNYLPIQTIQLTQDMRTQNTQTVQPTHNTHIETQNTFVQTQPINTVTRYFCEKHAKESTEWMLPNKSQTPASLNKLSPDDLQSECVKYSIEQFASPSASSLNTPTPTPNKTVRKKTMINALLKFFKEKTFETIQRKKQKNSKETDLISIGYNLRRELDKIQDFDAITNVIIENQISTLAARMNSIQGMIVQYFIMKESPERITQAMTGMKTGDEQKISIEFISSSNKLKGLPPVVTQLNDTKPVKERDGVENERITGANKSQTVDEGWGRILLFGSAQPTQKYEAKGGFTGGYAPNGGNLGFPTDDRILMSATATKENVNSKYKAHKKDGLYHCSLFLENNPVLSEWKHVLNTKKKDDYADCFLQGIWYMRHHHIFKESHNYVLEIH
jgi:hypothetical protein